MLKTTTTTITTIWALLGPVWPVSHAWAQQRMSAATKRALERGYDEVGTEFLVSFKQHALKGDFAYEKGIIRRDPSAVLQIDDLYHAWYTRGIATKVVGFGSSDPNGKVYPWDLTEIWHATSPDGWTWKEQGLAVGRGAAGAFDDRAVFTPEILKYNDKYYLVYQTVQAPYLSRTKNQVGMAIANSPHGPWHKLAEPILSPTENGDWLGDVDDRTLVAERGDFDSHKVHDPTLFFFKKKFYLYYKGQRIGEQLTFSGREIKHGVAVADHIEGPYVKSSCNPVSNSGHEIAMWHYRGGLATLLTSDGPERNTIQWSPDGINFAIKAHISNPPVALGIYRSDKIQDNDELPAGLQWGLAHRYHHADENSIVRYEVSRPVLRDPGFKKSRQ